jgi:hypothetical protein
MGTTVESCPKLSNTAIALQRPPSQFSLPLKFLRSVALITPAITVLSAPPLPSAILNVPISS